jgi:D-alanine-D-alanine ligase
VRVGLTYDLRDDYRALGFDEESVAEFDSPDTIDALAGALERLGYAVDRIGHIRALVERLAHGERWDFVFNVAEGVAGRSREAQVPALLEAYGIPYVMSDPLTAAATLDKAVAKRLVRDAGVPTAPFALLRDETDAAACELPFPLFVKPVAEGTGKGCGAASRVADRAALHRAAQAIRARYRQPAIAETFLPGREFTVGIVGNGADARVVAVMEIRLLAADSGSIYSFDDKERCETRVDYRLADDAEARRAGVPHFLEVNVLPGLHPTHSDLPILAGLAGMSYDVLIGRIVDACLVRTGLRQRMRSTA